GAAFALAVVNGKLFFSCVTPREKPALASMARSTSALHVEKFFQTCGDGVALWKFRQMSAGEGVLGVDPTFDFVAAAVFEPAVRIGETYTVELVDLVDAARNRIRRAGRRGGGRRCVGYRRGLGGDRWSGGRRRRELGAACNEGDHERDERGAGIRDSIEI